jgi:hypothetical protein
MRKLKLFLALTLLVVPMIVGAQVIVGMNVDVIVQDPSQAPANDFHVTGTVQSAGAVIPMVDQVWVFAPPAPPNSMNSAWLVTGYTVVQDPVNPDLFHFTVDYAVDQMATPGAVLNPGDLLHFGIIMRVNTCNVMVNVNGYFTFNGARMGLPVPLTGFVVIDPAQPVEEGMVQIHNNSEVPVEVTTLELCVLSEPVPLEDMFSTGLGDPGTGPSPGYPAADWEDVPHFMMPPLQPGEFFEIPLASVGINLQPGQFLLMRGYQKEEGIATNSKIPAAFWNQHEEP